MIAKTYEGNANDMDGELFKLRIKAMRWATSVGSLNPIGKNNYDLTSEAVNLYLKHKGICGQFQMMRDGASGDKCHLTLEFEDAKDESMFFLKHGTIGNL